MLGRMARDTSPPGAAAPDLPGGRLGDLFRDGRRVHLRPGASLLTEGDASNRVALVLSGRLKVSSYSDSGRETVLGFSGRGDVLGELSAIDGEPHSATVVAVESSEIAVLPADRFVAGLTDHPEVMLDLLRSVILRLRDADQKRAEFAELPADARVGERLVELAAEMARQEDSPTSVTVSITQAELAGWVGCSREAANKALNRFQERGLIVIGRGHLTILDPEGLRRHVAT
jgi:CRP/FNR family cyclic AMP-dependent transcriptional regulator